MSWLSNCCRVVLALSFKTHGQAQTSRYVWTNPLHRSASADGRQKNTSPPKQAVFGDEAVSDDCVRGTAIAVPDWALGGHLALSVNVRVSAERERVRLGYLADACITHRRDDVCP